MNGGNQVIFIGLDGLGYQEIGDWLSDGSFPNLASIRDEGTGSNLTSTHPPWTPCAWPSMLSGRNPGKHGVFDFFTRDGYEKTLIDRSDVDAPLLHEVVDANGFTPLLINFPVTHPINKLENGAIVPGYLANEGVGFYPSDIRERYTEEYGEYRIYPKYGGENAVQEYLDVARCRRNMAQFLDGQYDWDLLAVQFQVTDSIFHDLENRVDILNILKEIDKYVGEITELGDDNATILIASDHGMGDYEWTFYINSWLAENGYCETTQGNAQYFRQQKDKLKGTEKDGDNVFVGQIFKSVATACAQFGLSPQRAHRILSKIGVANVIEKLLPEEALVAAQNQIVDYEESIAFQIYYNSLGIQINLEGREPNGQVQVDKYDEIREEIMGKLRSVRDPNDELVFEDVSPRESIYSGKHLEDAPDIVIIPRDYQYDVSGSILDTFRHFPHKNHKPEGILFSNRSLGEIDKASIFDIAPTIAASIGIPVDSNTDGEVLPEISEEVDRKDWDGMEINDSSDRNRNDTEKVEDRLADLGYME